MLDQQFWEEAAKVSPMQAISCHEDEVAFNNSGAFEAQQLDEIVPSTYRGCILDYGCGIGRVSQHLVSLFDTVIAYDWSPTMLEAVKAKELTGVVTQCNLDLIRIKMDVIYSMAVFFHIERKDYPALFKRCASLLKPAGYFIFQLPVYDVPTSRSVKYSGGISTVTEAELKGYLKDSGFAVERIVCCSGQYIPYEPIDTLKHFGLHIARKI